MRGVLKFQTTFVKAIIVIVCFSSFVIFWPVSTQAVSIDDKRREIDELQRQIEANKAALQAKSAEANTLANQVAIMDGQILDTELQIRATQAEIDKTQLEIENLTQQIAQKEEELKKQKEILGEALRVIYEESETSLLETVVSSNSFSEILDRSEYLSAVENKIEVTLAEIAKLKKELEEKKVGQEKKKAELAELLNQQQTYLTGLAEQRSVKDSLLAQTRGEESAYQAQLKRIQELYAQANSELKAMEEAARGGTPSVPSPGGFYWPVNGILGCGFGYSSCYWPGVFHSGIDIIASLGTPVKASKTGTVIAVEDGWGNTYPNQYIYGNYVKIDHGGGVTTVYAHLVAGSIRVGVGTHVEGGSTIIGSVGNSGFSTGPHLHFEVRVSGVPIDPMAVLP